MAARQQFDPHVILAALERNYVDYVLIGGLARVLRGTDEVTGGVDICPLCATGNLERLDAALGELGAAVRGTAPRLDDETLAAQPVVAFMTASGPLNLIASPAGAPNGFVDLRRTATNEDLGHGLRPLVSSTGDLARMAAALGRDRDHARLRDLRRIIELEVDRQRALAPPSRSETARIGRAARAPRTTR
jgi:hypothetical protein